MGGRGGAGRARQRITNTPPQQPPSEEPPPPPPPESEPEPPTEQEPADAADRDESGGLESNIHNAYTELASRPQAWVRLSELRERLGHPDQAEMEQILHAMTRTGRVHLAPDSDRRALTAADHAAAVRIGREDRHLIAIEPADDDPHWR